MDYNTEGSRIRSLRMHLGLTQKEFAHALDLKQPYISEVEKDLTSISLETLKKMLDKWKYNPYFHVTGEGEMTISISSILNEPQSAYKINNQGRDFQNQEEIIKKMKEENEELIRKYDQLKDKYIELNEKYIALIERKKIS